MATDVILDQGDGNVLVLDARVVKAQGSDFILEADDRRKGGGPLRRALVHDQNDGLTVNFGGDYPGGITMTGVAEVTPQQGSSLTPTLVVRGDISFEEITFSDFHRTKGPVHAGPPFKPLVEGGFSKVTIILSEELRKMQSQIADLSAKVAALEAKS
jgi:hypothetical protein